MLIAAAFVPATALLVPQVASGAAHEFDAFRDASLLAVGRVLAADPTEILVIGPAPRTGPYPSAATWSFAGFGVPRDGGATGRVGVAGHGEGQVLPAALSVGRWLLEQAGESAVPVQAFGITLDDAPARCQDLGPALAARSERVGAVVVGDGSACRGPKAPGSFDERAEAFDDAWITALAEVDVNALAELDASLAAELLAAGRAPWQVAAAMVGDGSEWDAEVLQQGDPLGVMYAVATWMRSTA